MLFDFQAGERKEAAAVANNISYIYILCLEIRQIRQWIQYNDMCISERGGL